MPRAKVKFKPPGEPLGGPFWLSTEFPDDEFRILSAYPTERGLLVLLEATMADTSNALEHFESAPDERLPSREVLHADEETVLFQFQLPFVPPPFRALLTSGNLPQFPYALEDGWMVCELTSSQERLSQFGDELEETGFAFEVVWVTQSVDPTELLTDRQRQYVTSALERGYYDTPRRCSLTELADELGISKSTASTVLHYAEESIVKAFFAEAVE